MMVDKPARFNCVALAIVSIAFTMAFLYAGLKEKSLLPKPGEAPCR
ncbi:hypothetical protein [Burkholderia cepacia]|nr:hypothetical protein [Burkholderia cepacia]MBJ9753693.1 hypothetical protein [Burkholderia cepacia]